MGIGMADVPEPGARRKAERLFLGSNGWRLVGGESKHVPDREGGPFSAFGRVTDVFPPQLASRACLSRGLNGGRACVEAG